MTCTTCARPVPEASRFCPHCGAPADSGSVGSTRTSAPHGVSPSDPSDHGRFIPGTMLGGRYRVVGLLGRGGMGEVYRADDLKLVSSPSGICRVGPMFVSIAAACESAETTVSRVLAKARFWLRSQGTNLNDRQRKVLNRLLDAGPGGFEGGITTRTYSGLTRVSRATAYRELADLVAKGCLEPAGGGGRSRAYAIRRNV